MHVLPRVAELHEMFENELVVVGVHAGKYPAERVTERIRSACARLGVVHPVVNDRQFRVWRSYAVEAWPTVVLVTPDGRVAGTHAGEFETEEMAKAVRAVIESAAGTIDTSPRSFGADPLALSEPTGTLRFPGRVLLHGDRLFESDTGHRRVLECRIAGSGLQGMRAHVTRAFGSGVAGFADGSALSAALREPQGLALLGDALLVADRANHAVREIDLASGGVRTVAGMGAQARGAVGRGHARETALRSPWDVAPYDGSLAVAMAGSHQLYVLDLARDQLAPLAGTGAEDIMDGPAGSALLAQPMGLAASPGRPLAFCDAESSSARLLEGDGSASVRTLVGTGLFDFGDRDGAADEALLQHAEALAWDGETLIVADTYNDKLRRVDPASRRCDALPGAAGSGDVFAHPAGVTVDCGRCLVADTENHRIAVVDTATGEVATLEFA
jgi:DNA-binding beta-propeller fold protein YncE